MSDEKTIRPNEQELRAAALIVGAYGGIHFDAARIIATHTRHDGKTAVQWAEECRSYQRNLADAQADIAGEVEHSKELSTRVTELESLASRLKEQRDTPDKPSLWLCFNPHPEGEKSTVYHATLADAKAEAERLASKTGKKIHVVRIVGTACPPKPARWEER